MKTKQTIGQALHGLVIMLIMGMIVSGIVLPVQAQEQPARPKTVKEIMVKVAPQIIALPAGDATIVALSAARIRSADLRSVFHAYEAVSIEKLYELEATEKNKGNAAGDVLNSKKADEQKEKAVVDASAYFTNKIKKRLEDEKKKVVEVADVYLVRFEMSPEINAAGLVPDLRAVPIVKYAEEITRSE